MKLIAGLGNPGPKYEFTRHNIGFILIDALARAFSAPPFKSEKKALTTKIQFGSEKVLLVKPQTFMNLSGESVVPLMKYYDIAIEDILIAHDEIDLPFETTRFQTNRGHAGHNGIRDIHKHLNTKDYHRLKLGVGRPQNPRMDVHEHVLQNFSKEELNTLPDWMNTCCDAIETYAIKGYQLAATQFNTSKRNEE